MIFLREDDLLLHMKLCKYFSCFCLLDLFVCFVLKKTLNQNGNYLQNKNVTLAKPTERNIEAHLYSNS